jgi:hypothetical protein
VNLWIAVDVEADGPCPAIYSMVSFGAVVVETPLDSAPRFYGKTDPISSRWVPEVLAVSGITRDEHLGYPPAEKTMREFRDWLVLLTEQGKNSLVFVSDNPAYDWQFINYYLHRFCGVNPFGYSAKRIGCMYAGLMGNTKKSRNWRDLRTIKHTHNPVDDALGVAEVLIKLSGDLKGIVSE